MNYENVFASEEDKYQKYIEKQLKIYGLDNESIKEFRSKISKSFCINDNATFELFMAINSNDISLTTISELIFDGADIDYIISDETLLFNCICRHDLDLAILLIKAGCDIDYHDKLGQTYPVHCIEKNFPELLKVLVLYNSNINGIYLNLLLDYAKQLKCEECIEILENHINKKIEPLSFSSASLSSTSKKTEIELFSLALKEAENEMNEILDNTPYQKIKK